MIPAVEIPWLDPRVGFAFSAGLATFFAPCAYPLLPGYVAYFLGNDEGVERPVPGTLLRAVFVAGVTSLGFFLVYVALAGVALAAGTGVLGSISVLELVVGVVLVVLGVLMALGRFDPASLHVALPERERSTTGFFAFGVVYAAAAAGCSGPVFISIVGFGLSAGPAMALTMLTAYAAGMSLLMLVVTVLSAVGRASILRPIAARGSLLTRAGGVVLVAAGIVQIYFFLFEFDGLQMLGLA